MLKRHIHNHKKSITSPIGSTRPLNHHPCTSGRWPLVFQERTQKVLALRSLRIQMPMASVRLLLESVQSPDLPSRLASHRREWAQLQE